MGGFGRVVAASNPIGQHRGGGRGQSLGAMAVPSNANDHGSGIDESGRLAGFSTDGSRELWKDSAEPTVENPEELFWDKPAHPC